MKLRKEEKDNQKRKMEMEKERKEISKANQNKEKKVAVSLNSITPEPHNRLCSSLFLSPILLFPGEVPGQEESSNKLYKNEI